MKKLIILCLSLGMFFTGTVKASYVSSTIVNVDLSNTEKQLTTKVPRKVIEVHTNRDIYNALEEVYYKSYGDLDLVFRVAKYNKVPKKTMNMFIKNGKLLDYRAGDEYAFPWLGVVLESAVNTLTLGSYGGIINCLSGGDFAFVDKVPEGMIFEDAMGTTWDAGVQQAKYNNEAYSEDRPNAYWLGKIIAIIVLFIFLKWFFKFMVYIHTDKNIKKGKQ